MKFIIAKNYSLLLEYISLEFQLDLVNIIKTPSNINKIKPLNSIDIEYNLQDSEEGLFNFEEVTKEKYILVDLANIPELNSLDFNRIRDLENQTKIIFFNSEVDYKTEDKKILKTNNVEIVEIKSPDPKSKKLFLEGYYNYVFGDIIDQTNKSKIINKVESFTQDYFQMINILDFIFLSILQKSDNKTIFLNKILDQILETPETIMTFKLGLKDTSKWLTEDEGELQKNISIMASKAEKSKLKGVLKLIINCDKKIKTRSKIKPTTWYKLLLWQIKNN